MSFQEDDEDDFDDYSSGSESSEEEEDGEPEHEGVVDWSDLAELRAKLNEAGHATWVIHLAMGCVSLEQIKEIVRIMGRPLINIGDGLTLLHLAAQYEHDDIVEYLAGECKHPLEVKTVYGETPLDQAAWKGHIKTSIILLMYGADVDCQTRRKYTPLMRCAHYNHPQLANIFLHAGATKSMQDFEGKTAFNQAVEQGNDEMIKILQPVMVDGQDTTEAMYANNNPKRPEYQPEGRAAFLLWLRDSANNLKKANKNKKRKK